MEQLEQPAPLANISVKLVAGIFFAVLGLAMTLDNLGLFDPDPYLRYWPIVLLVIGILKLSDPGARGFAIASIIVGALLLARTTRWLHFSIFDLWPLLLIGAGALIILQAFRGPQDAQSNNWPAILTQRKVSITDQNFRGGRIVAFMGGCELDFAAADIQGAPAVIEILVLMGGIEMKVPEGWEVVGDVMPFMGGIDIKTRSKSTGRKLVLRGFVMMGGVEVKDAARIA